MDRVYRDTSRAQSGIRSLQNTDRSRISVCFPGEDQHLIALRNKNFSVNTINGDGLRVQQLGMRSENSANRSDIAVCITAESENTEGVPSGHEDLIVNRIIGHVVDRAGKRCILSCNRSYRLCTTIRQPGECRNLRVAHSV